MSNLSKPYAISIWDDVWDAQKGKFVEERFAVIGSNTMQSQNRALEPTLTRNVNGSKKFSFKICKRYKDSITGETIINPFAEYLISERKIKLEYDGEWFDFIIKNISEDSSKYIYTYQCEDALVNELSKNGFGVKLDSESVNNSGTLQKIAETVLEDTDWEVSSDVIVQTIEEPLVYIQIPANTTIIPVLDQDENDKTNGVSQGTPIKLTKSSRVLAFYSSCRNKPVHFQFIYFADESKYGKNVVKHNEDRVVTEKNCQYYIEYLNPDSYTANVQDYGFVLPAGFTVVAQSGGVEDTADTTISTWHRGARYVFSQETVYEPKLKRYVTKHTGPTYTEKNEKGETITKNEYHSYSSSEYISPELVQNIITNTDFKVSSGWTGTHFSSKGSEKATAEAVYGRFDESGFISAIDDLTNGETYDEQYVNHKAYMKLTMPAGSYVVNSGPYDNRTSIGQMEVGSEWALAIKNRSGQDLSSVEYELGEYEYDASTNGYKQIVSGIVFEKQTEEKDGYIIFKVISNPYLNKKKFKEDSNVRLRIKNTSSSEITHYIKTATLFRVHYTKNGNIVVPGKDLSTQGNDIGFVEEKYYYYKPSEMNNFSEEADFQPSVCLDKPTYETYEPYFHMDAEKIRSVTAKESNYFNILQTLAETFETWMLIDVERNSSGQITKKKIKYKQYIGEKNYANFRYGVNLKDIKRVFESKALVTKLIVKDNSNEFAKNGFCTIARAKANPLGENCLYDFQYYFNTGIMNARDHLDTMYTTSGAKGKDVNTSHTATNAIGYYPRIRALNDKLDSFTESIAALNTGLIRLKADAEVEKAAKEAAESGAEEAADSFAYLTGCDIRKYNSSDITDEKGKVRSDVQKQLTAYTTCMTELNRATAEYNRLTELIKTRECQIKAEQDDFNTWRNYKITLNKAFYTKYSRFIQEGTWIDEEYLDDEKYYADAQSVLYNSCYPQVTYSINVLALSALPGYEMFKFGLGDRTFVEDPEFFGREYKEEVVLTEFVENLDSPEKNTIKVQNFKNQFQDLFQKITATVQQAQYRTGSYEKAAALAEAASAKKYQFLTDALAGAEAILSAAGQQTVIIDKSGITITDDDSPCNQIRLIGGAILISTDDGNGVKKWKTAMTHQGISASLITAGVINAGEICIMNSEEPAFRWDAFGLTAFDATWFDGVASDTKYTKFVRMDKHGLYGMNGLDPNNAITPDGRTWHAQDAKDIDKYATFALTWDGLKVLGNSGIVARIGRYDDKIINIVKETDGDPVKLFTIGTDGSVYIQIVKDLEEDTGEKMSALDEKLSLRMDGIDKNISDFKLKTAADFQVRDDAIAARVCEFSGDELTDESVTRFCEWKITPGQFYVLAYDKKEDQVGGIVVDKDGLTVTGILNAKTGGNIGGFSIQRTALYNGKKTIDDPTDGVYLGTNGISLGSSGSGDKVTAAFKVTSGGFLYAVKGTIGGFTITGSSLYNTKKELSDDTSNGVYIGTDGISLGVVTKDDTNYPAFQVTSTGALTAHSATIYGAIYASSGSFNGSIYAGGGTIGNWHITGGALKNSTSGATIVLDANAKGTNPIIKAGSNFQVLGNGNVTVTGAITATSLSLGADVKVSTGNISGLSTVATTGAYDDLSGKPDLSVYAYSSELDAYIKEDALSVSSSTDEDGIKTTSITFNGTKYSVITSSNGDYILTDVGLGSYTTDGSKTYAKIKKDGTLEAHNAIIYGTIFANSGSIGGLTLNNGNLYTGNCSSVYSVNSGVFLGATGINLYKDSTKYFRYVASTGNVTIKGGSISGTISGTFSGTISAGSYIAGDYLYITSIANGYVGRIRSKEINTGGGYYVCSRLDLAANWASLWCGTSKTSGEVYVSSSGGQLFGTWKRDDGDVIKSDRRFKHSIQSIPQKYEILFDNLNPVVFKYDHGLSDRLHGGFVAQEVQEALVKADISEKDFAALVTSTERDGSERMGLRYVEFISMNTWQIQKLKQRVAELEARLEKFDFSI
jgi:hypothetical protein